ncbi:hypothetical protein Tco_0022985 [Tanacetum coccineum]
MVLLKLMDLRLCRIPRNKMILIMITTTNEVPSRKPIVLDSESPKPVVKLVYSRKPIVLDSESPKPMDLCGPMHVLSVNGKNENLGKLQPKADIGIFIGYAPTKKAFRIYNRRTRRIIETIHVDFDKLTAMASEHSSSGPALHEMTPVSISSGLVQNPSRSTPFVPPSRSDWDLLFKPMFNESPNVDLQAPEVIAPIPEAVAPEVIHTIVPPDH